MPANHSAARRAERKRDAILSNPTVSVMAHLLARVEGRSGQELAR